MDKTKHLPPEIKLRAPEPSDLDMLYRLENLPEIRGISWGEAPVSRQMLWEYVNSYSADIYRDRQLRLMIECDGRAVGTIDLSDFDPANSRAMVGVAVLVDYRRRGIAMQALSQAISYCMQALGMHQLCAIVPKDNTPSVRLFRKLGFKSSGCLRSWVKRGAAYADAIVFQLMLQATKY